MADRRQNFQNISWFWDLKIRNRLDMEPPYQRRSVWSRAYQQQFIDTILLNYPAPALFLFARIDEHGSTHYEIVDGKQRLTAIFDFLDERLPIGDASPIENLRGQYFSALPKDQKVKFYEYDFSVEYLPTNNEQTINDIFNRLNRNVAKLTPQELRHAQFNGRFITCAERLADLMMPDFEAYFPRIATGSRRQMKDIEFVATLLLLLEEGPKGYSVAGLDKAFSDRDEQWDSEEAIESSFREIHQYVLGLMNNADGVPLNQTRLRNQADYYSLFGAIAELRHKNTLPAVPEAVQRLRDFVQIVESEDRRAACADAVNYYEAARSASNDASPRAGRIHILARVLAGTVVCI